MTCGGGSVTYGATRLRGNKATRRRGQSAARSRVIIRAFKGLPLSVACRALSLR